MNKRWVYGSMVNYIWLAWQLAWQLACMLRIYRTCNSTVGFSKYEFINKLLDSVTLLKRRRS